MTSSGTPPFSRRDDVSSRRRRDPLATEVLALLARSGRNVQREGKPATDQAEARGIVANVIRNTLEQSLPVFRSLGVLEA